MPSDAALPPRRPPAHAAPIAYRTHDEVVRLIAASAEPFETVDAAALGPVLDRIGDAEVVLIGEATHGTREFYLMRQRLTRALVAQKGFRIVAAEADWPDAERIDEYVRLRAPRPAHARDVFARFPTWMWRNAEVLGFVAWLRAYNEARGEHARAGFYGLDLYSLYTSMHEVLAFLDRRLPALAREGRARYSCLAPFEGAPDAYGHAVVTRQYGGCEDEAVAMLRDLLAARLGGGSGEAEPLFDATENARVVRDAERYYRAMYHGDALSWNLRDTHMFDTLEAVRRHRDGAKAVVWAHNSHVGDAAFTEMGRRGELNVGHLCRAHYGDAAYLIGFGTHTGTVAAAHRWGGDVQTMPVRPARNDAYEGLCHASGVPGFFLPLRTGAGALRNALASPRLERAIGVIYRPETERQSHYFEAELPHQFDEYVWIDETHAVTPLGPSHAPDLPNRHPFRLLAD